MLPSDKVISSPPDSDLIKSKEGNFAISDVRCERTKLCSNIFWDVGLSKNLKNSAIFLACNL
jgi:hypothetical protein